MSLSVDPVTLTMTPPIEFFRLGAIPPASSVPASPASSSGTADSSATVSDQGALLSQLQTLNDTQPEIFQATLTQAASGLSAAASQAGTSTPQGQLLSKSAATIQQVATSGDVSQLQPAVATNVVEKTYGPNQADGGQGVLSLLSSGTQAAASNNLVQGNPTLFSPPSEQNASSSNFGQVVAGVLQELQKALAQ
jgi:hypothetical protein